MGEFAKNATVTKIRAIYGKRLNENDYKELLSKKSVAEVAEYLKHSPNYKDAFTDIDTATIRRGHLETVLRRHNFERYGKICNFQNLDKQPFYTYLIKWSEIEELLVAILHLNANSSETYIENLPTYLIHKSSFDLIGLAKARNYKQLLDVIKHTPYYAILKQIEPDKDNRVDEILCETKLRTYYLNWLLGTVNKDFHGNTRKTLAEQIQLQIDIVNIINAYRMKTYFNASADEIRTLLLPFKGRITDTVKEELISSQNAEDFERVLSKTNYGRQLEELDGGIEHKLTELRCRYARRGLTFSQNSASSLYSAVYLFDVELGNIIRIIEGIRYGRPVEDIEALLVL